MPLNFRFMSTFTTGFSLERRFCCHCYCSNTALHVNQYGWCGLLRNCTHCLNSLLHDSLSSLWRGYCCPWSRSYPNSCCWASCGHVAERMYHYSECSHWPQSYCDSLYLVRYMLPWELCRSRLAHCKSLKDMACKWWNTVQNLLLPLPRGRPL